MCSTMCSDMKTISKMQNLRFLKIDYLSDSPEDEDIIDNLELAIAVIDTKFHVDVHVEIEISTLSKINPNDVFLKGVLIKKSGFRPALMPPLISKMSFD